jgi:P4 family phage/plasmid primase-like protien
MRAVSVARGWLGLLPTAQNATHSVPPAVAASVFAAPDDEPPDLRFIPPPLRRQRAQRWLAKVPREAHGDGSGQLVRVAAILARGFALGEGVAYELLSRSALAEGWSEFDLHRRCADAMRGPHGREPMVWGGKLLPASPGRGGARGNAANVGEGRAASSSDDAAPRAADDVEASAAVEGETVIARETAEHSDIANAEQLVADFGGDLRFVGAWGKGLAWDGARWILDDGTRWQHCAMQTARGLYARARGAYEAALGSGSGFREAEASLEWAASSQSAPRVAAMATLARSVSGVAISHEQLDADPWLLNVRSGTIDLRTGEQRAHRRDDLNTKLASVDYDPNARAPTWEAFLRRAMAGDHELVAYLQRLIGYALTGSVQEHVLVFFYGGGANGKSTFLSTIHALLGDYATPAPRGLLFRSRGERHPTELATLFGRRFVTCSEIEEGQVFDEALTKDLTGGDRIECRRMREDFWTYGPTHKLFMAGNHKPTVRGDDEGIWRRMRLVPWTVTIPEGERDPALPGKLALELPGILRWAVDGCLAWQSSGLAAPAAVRSATDEYREENDTLGEFFRLHVAFEPDATIVRRDLREAYETWCKENGQPPFAARRFASRLRESGVVEANVRRGMKTLDGWRNVRLITDAEKELRAAAAAVSAPSPAAPPEREPLFSDDLAELGVEDLA